MFKILVLVLVFAVHVQDSVGVGDFIWLGRFGEINFIFLYPS